MVNATVQIYNSSSSLLNDKKYINLTNLQLANGLYKNKLAQVYDLKFANLLCNIYSNYESSSATSIIKFFKPVALNGLKAKAQARQGYIGIYGSNDNVNYTQITVFKAIQNNIDFEAVWDNEIKYSYYKFDFYKGSDWACYHYINLYTYIPEFKEIQINKVIKENINTLSPTSDKFNIYISNNNELYITDNDNSIIKIIHSHMNNNVLDKFSTDNDGNLLYNNKLVKYSLTEEDKTNIINNIFNQT